MNSREQKTVLREELKKHRQLLKKHEVVTTSQQILAYCVDFIPWGKVRSLHTYAPIAEQNEVDIWPLLRYIWRHQPHITTFVPIMNNLDMNKLAVNSETSWQKNAFGIPEPVNIPASSLFHQFDIIIVPTLGFDNSGSRLGYGHGYYDRFLTTQPYAATIGLTYASAEVKPGLPAETHDARLDNVITERGVLKFHTKT